MKLYTYVRAIFACSMTAVAVLPAGASARSGARMNRAERAVVREVNAQRARSGLAALRATRSLGRSADFHSRDMGDAQFFDHPSSDGQSAYDRVRSFRRSNLIGETLAYMPIAGDRSPEHIVQMWMASPPHRETLMTKRFRRVGVAQRRGTYGGRRVVFWTADLTSAR